MAPSNEIIYRYVKGKGWVAAYEDVFFVTLDPSIYGEDNTIRVSFAVTGVIHTLNVIGTIDV